MKNCIFWKEGLAYPREPAVPAGMEVSVIQWADEEFPFLHETNITQLGGRLIAGWFNCAQDEIIGKTLCRGRWLEPDGSVASRPMVITQDPALHTVPITFFAEESGDYAFSCLMEKHDTLTGYVVFRRQGDEWMREKEGSFPLLINSSPFRLPDGRWVAAGRFGRDTQDNPKHPCIVRFRSVLDEPDVIPMPGPWNEGDFTLRCPETAIFVDGNRLQTIVRNEVGPDLTFESFDGGDTWTQGAYTQMPINGSKLCCDTLSTGRQFMIYNEKVGNDDRRKLVLALRDGMDSPFDTLYLLRDGYDEALGCGPNWHYPSVWEKDGILYISCTISGQGPVRHAGLIRVPVASL